MLKVGSVIVIDRVFQGLKIGHELTVFRINKDDTFDAKDERLIVYRLYTKTEGETWRFKEDERIIKDSSDLTYLEANDLYQLQHAAVIINDRNWFEEIGKEIKKLKNELECLQDGYKQCGIEW